MRTNNIYFNEIESAEQLKNLYRQLCKKLHPDKGGTHEDFVRMNNEYCKIMEAIQKGTFKFSGNVKNASEMEDMDESTNFSEIMDFINSLPDLVGCTIEIIGSWVWINGETFQHKDYFNSNPFIHFSGSHKNWFWNGSEKKDRRKKGNEDMDDIRSKYGSKQVYKAGRRKLS